MRRKIRRLFGLLAGMLILLTAAAACLYGMGDERAYFKKGSVGEF